MLFVQICWYLWQINVILRQLKDKMRGLLIPICSRSHKLFLLFLFWQNSRFVEKCACSISDQSSQISRSSYFLRVWCDLWWESIVIQWFSLYDPNQAPSPLTKFITWIVKYWNFQDKNFSPPRHNQSFQLSLYCYRLKFIFLLQILSHHFITLLLHHKSTIFFFILKRSECTIV